jgi:hypothetical protein
MPFMKGKILVSLLFWSVFALPVAEAAVVGTSTTENKALVGFSVEFSSKDFSTGTISLSPSYFWNFGDGAVATGTVTTHAYRFSGDYVVTLEVISGSSQTSEKKIISIMDPNIWITDTLPGDSGYVEITNKTSFDVDLSGWKLGVKDITKNFSFPEHTILLSGSSEKFPNQNTALVFGSGDTIDLLFPNGNAVSTHFGAQFASTSAGGSSDVGIPRNPEIKKQVKTTSPAPVPAVTDKGVKNSATTTTGEANTSTNTDRIDPVGADSSRQRMWLLILAVAALVAAAGYIIIRSRVDEASPADEYAIMEDIFEGIDAGSKGEDNKQKD